MKHTPGPWTYEGGDNASCEVSIGNTTACITRYDKNTWFNVIERSEMEANAKLIAAAPELLECLINLQEFISPESVYWGTDLNEKVEMTIKKATE